MKPTKLSECNRGDLIIWGHYSERKVVKVVRVTPKQVFIPYPGHTKMEQAHWIHSGLEVGCEDRWVRIAREGEISEVSEVQERRNLIAELDCTQWASMSLADLRRVKQAIESTKKPAPGNPKPETGRATQTQTMKL